jgi:hypothetical protein
MLLAVVAIVQSRRARSGWPVRTILVMAWLLALWSAIRLEAPSHASVAQVAAVALATAATAFILDANGHRGQMIAGIASVVALGAPLLLDHSGPAYALAFGPWFAASHVLAALSGGILLAGALLPASGDMNRGLERILPLALLTQSASLVGHGVGAQRAWAAYWSWDPIECWLLAIWLVIAIALAGRKAWGWGGGRFRWPLWAPAVAALLVLLGALPLVHALGLDSVFVR